MSSIITIIGTKLSNKRPNKKHPYGYGRIEIEVFDKYGIILTIGVYVSNEVGEFKNIKKYLINILKNYKNVIQMHGFYVDEEYKIISFDLIFDFDEENPLERCEEIKNKLKEKYPKYNYSIILDTDVSD